MDGCLRLGVGDWTVVSNWGLVIGGLKVILETLCLEDVRVTEHAQKASGLQCLVSVKEEKRSTQ